MNTIGSVYYGWAFLILCGGGSYYFAKRSITADRYERQAAENERRMRQSRIPAPPRPSTNTPIAQTTSDTHAETKFQKVLRRKGESNGDPGDQAFTPSTEATADPAPADRAPGDTVKQEESKFESSRPFKSRKGDRFS